LKKRIQAYLHWGGKPPLPFSVMEDEIENKISKEFENFTYKEKFDVFLDLIELIEIRDRNLSEQYKKFSCDSARFRDKENQANYLKEIGKAIYEGRDWAMDIYRKLLNTILRS